MDTETWDSLLSDANDEEEEKVQFNFEYDKFYARVNSKNEDIQDIWLKPNVIRQIDVFDEKFMEFKTILEKWTSRIWWLHFIKVIYFCFTIYRAIVDGLDQTYFQVWSVTELNAFNLHLIRHIWSQHLILRKRELSKSKVKLLLNI